jgi:hypothetical protein
VRTDKSDANDRSAGSIDRLGIASKLQNRVLARPSGFGFQPIQALFDGPPTQLVSGASMPYFCRT